MLSAKWSGKLFRLLPCIVLAFVLAGCATTGDDQLASTVYQTHRVVKKLETDLTDGVSKLNVTAADLNAQVGQTDTEIRRLQGLMEEQQQRLTDIQNQVADLKRTLYRQSGLSESSGTVGPPPSGILPSSGVAPIAGTPAPSEMDGGAAGITPPAPAASGNSDAAVQAYTDAQRKYIAQDYEGALRAYEDYVLRFPSADYAPYAQFWAADCYMKLADARKDAALYEKSIQEFDKVVTNYPQSTKKQLAKLQQARAYRQMGQADKAKQILQTIMQEQPASPEADQARTLLMEMGSN